jgi:RNA polymerase sigma-70 factor (ECF subfamily)
MGTVADSNDRFGTTRWTLVLRAAGTDGPDAMHALDRLCSKYWYPIYAFVRRQGRPPHEAEDLTQGFFADLLSRDWLAGVAAEKGRFRTFLLACLRNHLSHVRAHEGCLTRYPGQPIISFDARAAEDRYGMEPSDVRDPATLFERRLAFSLIDDVLKRVREDYAAEGKAALFDALRDHLVGDAERGRYAETAAKLNQNEGATRVAVTRLRERFRERLRAEVARTVEDPRDIDEELRHLFATCSRVV